MFCIFKIKSVLKSISFRHARVLNTNAFGFEPSLVVVIVPLFG